MDSDCTVSPDCCCGFDQNDRAGINPHLNLGRELGPYPADPHYRDVSGKPDYVGQTCKANLKRLRVDPNERVMR